MEQQKSTANNSEEKKAMRDDIAFFVLNCSVFKLQRMHETMRRLKNENSDT